jgi:hypothetical protein
MPTPVRRRRKFRLLVLFVVPVIFWGAWFHFAHSTVHRLAGPRLVYWAWERPENLQFLDAKTEGVAFLSSSVELLPDSVHIYPRMQPLYLPPGIQVVAVVRIYSHPASPAALNEQQFSDTLQAVVNSTHLPNVAALQIDFDARESERAFYSRLLAELRRQLGPAYPISITALASWCIGDRWIHALPVNEAVPMLFSMGPDEPLIRHYLASVDTFPEPLCRGSLGISTGERWPNPIRSGARVYVFHRQPWTQKDVEDIRSRIHRGM